jgi:hypothetical protein
MSEVLSPAQRRTVAAREAFAAKFPSPEAKSEHFRAMAERAHAGRVVLRAEDAAALSEAYRLLAKIADRLPDPSESAA